MLDQEKQRGNCGSALWVGIDDEEVLGQREAACVKGRHLDIWVMNTCSVVGHGMLCQGDWNRVKVGLGLDKTVEIRVRPQSL